jgi:hypothetical protein
VLSIARPFLAASGVVLISDPPDGRARWSMDLLAAIGMRDDGRCAGVHRFSRVQD